jgi:hypothetical protein
MSGGSDGGDPSRSLHAKRLRQAAENDVQFLANRIAKLKAEEVKARKEIEKTRSKTKEIVDNKVSFKRKMNDKEQIRGQVVNSKKEERVMVSLNKDKQVEAVYLARQRLLRDKQEAVSQLRKQKEINECRIHIQKEEDRDKNIRRREDIKKQQVYSKMKREKEQEEKSDEVRKIYEERIAAEEAERDRQEKLAAQLVAQEAQLIYRLKQLHSDKQKAIRELASAVDCLKADEIDEEIEGEGAEEEEPLQEIEEELS